MLYFRNLNNCFGLTKITQSKFLVKVQQKSFHGSSKSSDRNLWSIMAFSWVEQKSLYRNLGQALSFHASMKSLFISLLFTKLLRKSAILKIKQLSQLYCITSLFDWMKLGSLIILTFLTLAMGNIFNKDTFFFRIGRIPNFGNILQYI